MASTTPSTSQSGVRDLRAVEFVLLGVGVLAIAAVTWFDLQTSLPFLDEYARRWSIQMLVAGNGFQSLGTSPQLVQLLLSAPLAWLKTDPAVWRLTAVPFIAMQGIFCGVTARDLGAGRFWAVVAGVAVVCNPLNLIVSTGMMTETVFLGLFAGAVWSSVRWIERGEARWACVALTVLAVLQRPQGAGGAAAVVLGLILLSRRRRPLRSDLAPAAALVLLSFAAYKAPEFLAKASPHLAGAAPGSVGEVLSTYSGVSFLVYVLANFPALLGLASIPFAAALWGARPKKVSGGRYLWVLPTMLAFFALAFVGLFVIEAPGRTIFIGNMFGAGGMGAALLGGAKVSPYAAGLFLLVVVLSIASYLLLLVKNRNVWAPASLGDGGQLLVMHAALQLAFIVGHGQVFDRYYLAMILPLMPIVAATAAAAGTPPVAVGWATMAMIGSFVLYVVGTQDYVAWQVARHRAAQIAYSQAPVDQVEAGFEEDAENIWLPANVDPTGTLPRGVVRNPKFALEFAAAGDPRPGVGYSSLAASGKIVISRRN